MTREEAIKVLEMFLHKQCDLKRTEFAYDANTVWGAVKMASEALEQEQINDVLDKIKAEIEKISTNYCGGYIGLDKQEVLGIIENYKKE